MQKSFLILTIILFLAACSSGPVDSSAQGNLEEEAVSGQNGSIPTSTSQCVAVPDLGTRQSLTVLVHDSFAVSEDVIATFETLYNVQVTFIRGGDAGSMLNRAILTKDNPAADVMYGVDNTFLSRALQEGIFEPYSSPLLLEIPGEYKLDPGYQVLPVDYGDVCINYDVAYFESHNLPVPHTLQELTDPAYTGLLVMENPATSSPGLAFLLATVVEFGDPGYVEYWQQLKDNDVVIVNDWSTAYYTNFSASSGQGEQPMIVSYASSPAAEVYFADPPRADSPTASITDPGTCFRQVEFVGILKGTEHRYLAEKFIDFMLGVSFQEDIPLQMFMYPVNQSAILPQVFIDFASVSSQPAVMDPAVIAVDRETWIQNWSSTVLR